VVGLTVLNELLRPFFDGVKVGIKDGLQVEGNVVGFLLGITVGFLEGANDVGVLEGFLDGPEDFDCAVTFTAYICEGIDVGMVADIFPTSDKIKLTKTRENFIFFNNIERTFPKTG